MAQRTLELKKMELDFENIRNLRAMALGAFSIVIAATLGVFVVDSAERMTDKWTASAERIALSKPGSAQEEVTRIFSSVAGQGAVEGARKWAFWIWPYK